MNGERGSHLEQVPTFLRTDSYEKFKKLLKKHSLRNVFTLTDDGVNTKVLHTRFYADEVWTQESPNETTEQLQQSVTGAGIFSDGSPLPPALYDELEDITDRLTVGIVAKKAKSSSTTRASCMAGAQSKTIND